MPSSLSPAEIRFFSALAQAHGTPLLVLEKQRLRAQYQAITRALPGVALHYALKALPHPAVVQTLAALGAGFDVASCGELALLRQARIDPHRLIHTHPIKRPGEIQEALAFGCRDFVFDNPAELEKFRPYGHRVRLILRIGFRNPAAGVDLSRKFGCALEEVPPLLQKAQQLGLRVQGFSFHVGSQCADASAHVAAIRQTLDLMRAAGDRQLQLLDIGGGFPVDYGEGAPSIEQFCAPIAQVLKDIPKWLRVVAEPGRILVAPAVTGLFQVIGKAVREGKPWYYLNDGVYGAFSGILFERAHYPIRAIRGGKLRESLLAGPTCDSIDIIADTIPLPPLQIGDLVIAEQMGAYTIASATNFNSFPKTPVLPMESAGEL